ncbi:uncharacterized protein EAE97_000573 [Botrytis byssoidea]|uniref:Uncharacterized protein n=1 Tax=Botrytis byssoidea TaxID=139641 RepID=A0A9P5IYE3_9HELO|nr:uncharacterized protein EAE97_000573 [Botrytis byssoidea]KAF7955314.1 hypothetical protein EAE97_000573 [Botrytis byssoidea]
MSITEILYLSLNLRIYRPFDIETLSDVGIPSDQPTPSTHIPNHYKVIASKQQSPRPEVFERLESRPQQILRISRIATKESDVFPPDSLSINAPGKDEFSPPHFEVGNDGSAADIEAIPLTTMTAIGLNITSPPKSSARVAYLLSVASRAVRHLSHALIQALMFTFTASHLAQKRWPSIKDSDLQSTRVAWGLHPLAHFIISELNQKHASNDALLAIECKPTVQKIHLNSTIQANTKQGLRERKEHNLATPQLHEQVFPLFRQEERRIKQQHLTRRKSVTSRVSYEVAFIAIKSATAELRQASDGRRI